ncbi:hypothetical protein [Burkholderia pseudomultivorans]|uniref:hypothetical protein n=1 Tax=Burkholderia pseudomultivorans TaxID=1207504 RepID=UPI0012D86600|nr:hypothetical protein [Burkholderia pseudomultivorans]
MQFTQSVEFFASGCCIHKSPREESEMLPVRQKVLTDAKPISKTIAILGSCALLGIAGCAVSAPEVLPSAPTANEQPPNGRATNDAPNALLGPILATPKASEQPKNEWFTNVWGIQPQGGSRGLTTARAFGTRMAAAGNSSPITIGTTGAMIDVSIDTRGAIPASGKLLTVMHKKLFQPAQTPWANGGQGFAFSVDLDVKSYEGHGRAVGYTAVIFSFTDPETKKSFWLVANLFDPRGNPAVRAAGRWNPPTQDKVNCSPSQGTSLPIASTFPIPSAQFIHLAGNSHSLTTEPTGRPVHFSFAVLRQNMEAIMRQLSSGSSWCLSPDNYRLVDFDRLQLDQISIEVEAHTGDKAPGTDLGEFTRMAVEFSKPKFELIHH